MEEADFSEASTSKQREDLPYDVGFSQTRLYENNVSSNNDILDVSDQEISTVKDPQEKTTCEETCRSADAALTLDKTTENVVEEKCDQEQQCTTNLPIPANKGDLSKSNFAGILQRHPSKEEFFEGQGIHSEILPEIPSADSFEEAIVKNIILYYVKCSWPKGQTLEPPDQFNPKRDGDSGSKPSGSPTTTEGNTAEVREPVAAGDCSHPESSNFLTQTKSPSSTQKGCQGQTPQNQQTERTRSDHRSKEDQVHYQFYDFSNIVPKVKIPKNNITDKPFLIHKQVSFSPEVRDRLALVQDILESTSRPNCAEKEDQRRRTTDPPGQTGMEPVIHVHQGHLSGTDSETSLFKLSSTSQKDPSSSSYIFQKISQGKKMCQKLKERTDRLKTKVQEFSKSIAQDSSHHVQDRRLVLEKLQGHLEHLEQQFVGNEKKHLTLKPQVHEYESPAVSDFDPERRAPTTPQGRNVQGRNVRRQSVGAVPSATGSLNAPGTGRSCYSACGTGLLSNRCETCGTKILGSPRGCDKDPLKEFCYRYNTPGQNCLNHSEGSAFVQLSFLNENKNSSPDEQDMAPFSQGVQPIERKELIPSQHLLASSKPNWIRSQDANSKSSQDAHEPTPEKKDLKAFTTYSSGLAVSSPHFHPGKISGGKSLSNFSSTEGTQSEDLNSSLDHALRTATVLKETTDQMIRTIAEDLAKVQTRRNRLKY